MTPGTNAENPEGMRSFWNSKADENPLWYIASNLEYGSPDEQRFWSSGEEEVAAALAVAGVSSGAVAVDIGCGIGRLSRALASRFRRVEARDVSTRMVEMARERLGPLGNVGVAAVPGDGSLDLADGSADLVFSLQVFQHIPDRRVTLRYIAEAGRVLVPRGTFVFQLRSMLRPDPVIGPIELAMRVVAERLRRVRKRPAAGIDSPAWHGSRVGLWQIRRTAGAAGMSIVGTRWISRRGASLLVVCRKEP